MNLPTCGSSQSSLSARVDAFVAKYNGKYVDYDGAYGAQCVDLFNFYSRDVVQARFAAVNYAYQLYDVYDSSKYTRLAASATPAKGDVAIWSSNYPGSYGAGHVAIVLSTRGRRSRRCRRTRAPPRRSPSTSPTCEASCDRSRSAPVRVGPVPTGPTRTARIAARQPN